MEEHGEEKGRARREKKFRQLYFLEEDGRRASLHFQAARLTAISGHR
jgi:hypothetical protein